MKYHNPKLQTSPWHHEEEPHNNHETPERQTKQSYQLSLPHQDDCKTSIGHRVTHTKPEQLQNPTMGETNNNEPTTTEQSHYNGQQPKPLGVRGGGGLNAFYWYQIFALDYVVKAQNMLSSRGGFLTIAMYHHRKTI